MKTMITCWNSDSAPLSKPKTLLLLALLSLLNLTIAQGCQTEIEPNDQPAQATPLQDMGCIFASFEGGQDIYHWQVTEEGMRNRRVQLAFKGPRGEASKLVLLKTKFSSENLPINNLELFSLDSQGERAVSSPTLKPWGLLFRSCQQRPGEYLIDLQVPNSASLGGTEDREPNQNRDEAKTVRDRFEFQGNLEGSTDYYLWELGEEASEQLWSLRAESELGTELSLKVYDQTGQEQALLKVRMGF
ncbi:MAG: hypothetical protein R2865_12035 [Deinococcales bacterium]